MKSITFRYLICLIVLVSCVQKSNNEKAKIKDSISNTSLKNIKQESKTEDTYDSSIDRWKFKKYLNDSKTPQLAKQIFYNNWTPDDEALVFLSNLSDSDKQARPFYFRVVTNSFNKSDGAYSEGLGNAGYEYVKNNPKEFANYFIGQNSFTINDLNTWADIVLLEMSLLDENANPNKESLVEKYLDEIVNNCDNCSKEQSNIIKQFGDILRKKWHDYLLQTKK